MGILQSAMLVYQRVVRIPLVRKCLVASVRKAKAPALVIQKCWCQFPVFSGNSSSFKALHIIKNSMAPKMGGATTATKLQLAEVPPPIEDGGHWKQQGEMLCAPLHWGKDCVMNHWKHHEDYESHDILWRDGETWPWLPLSDLEVTCDPGFILDISKLEEGGTKEECCLKSCEFFKCYLGHISDHRVEREGQVWRVKMLIVR